MIVPHPPLWMLPKLHVFAAAVRDSRAWLVPENLDLGVDPLQNPGSLGLGRLSGTVPLPRVMPSVVFVERITVLQRPEAVDGDRCIIVS